MERKLAAILAADVVGYSRLMGNDETGTLAALRNHRKELIEPKAAQYRGRTVKLMGDGALMVFNSVVDAVTFAVEIQVAMKSRNDAVPEDQRIIYRIGINLGDIILENEDIYGDGVNVASRLEGLAQPGGICLSRAARDQVCDKLNIDLEDLGEIEVKNIARPVRVFGVVLDDKADALATPLVKISSATMHPRLLAIAAGIAVVALLLVGLGWWQSWKPEFEPVPPETMAQPLPAKPSIAVLAFDDFSSGDDRNYLSEAISEGIITELSRFSELFVIARNSSFHYRGEEKDVRDIARELGVRYILEGSQQKAGDRLRVTVQLIDAIAGSHVWAETYDRELADIFSVQTEISDSVASTLGKKLTRLAGEEAQRADPARLRAFEHWLAGMSHFQKFTREGSKQARLAFLRAIEADPTLARARTGLAWTYINGYRWGWTELGRHEALARARAEARIALNLAPDDYYSHFTMASVHMQAGERELAISEFEKSLELNPNSGDVMATMAEVLGYTGRMPQAIELLQRAMRLDPHHPEWFYWNLGWAQYSTGSCDEALATMRKMSSMQPLANRTLASIFVCLGRADDAHDAIAALLDYDPEYSIAKFRLNFQGKYANPEDLERWIDDLRVAGLPE